jgi:hypothetical protein
VTRRGRYLWSIFVALWLVAAAATPAAAAPTYQGQMYDINRLENRMDLGTFLYNRNNHITLGLGWADWSSDGCSNPMGGNGYYNFVNPCLRHDFGYRNLKRVENTFGSNVWSQLNKGNVDTRFGADLDLRCNAFPDWQRPGCQADAEIYESAVRNYGGDFDTDGIERYYLIW